MATPSASEIQYQLAHVQDDRSNDIVIYHALCLPFAVIAVALRLMSRRLCKASIQTDDLMIIAALVRSLVTSF